MGLLHDRGLQSRLRSVDRITIVSEGGGVLTSIEVCAGAGGQALGLEQARFQHVALIENDRHACATLRRNRPYWNTIERDVRSFDATEYRNSPLAPGKRHGLDLLAGGVPCPPFSKAGRQRGSQDERDLFPEMIRLAKECEPNAVLIENVRGLLDPIFDEYRADMTVAFSNLGYKVLGFQLLEASDFGVPQLRPRVAFVALKPEYSDHFSWPSGTRSSTPTIGEALYPFMAENGWEGAEAWRDQAITIAPTLVGGSKLHGGPDLGPTRARRAWHALGVNGKLLAANAPEAGFVGHPNLTVRMAACVQGFPDDWEFVGLKTQAYRQVGNAFPPPVARAIGLKIANAIRRGSR